MVRWNLRARATLVAADTLRPGGVAIDGGKIAGLLPPEPDDPPVIVAAGLRNAHSHLDLSDVPFLRQAAQGFAAWIRALLERRGPLDPARAQRAASKGARWALRTGTVGIVDVDSSGAAASAVAATGLSGAVLREALGRMDPDELRGWLERFARFAPGGRLRPGVSPHAPYSTGARLYRACAEWAASGVVWQSHVAETQEEDRLLERGDGPLKDLLEELGAGLPFPRPPGCGPIRYLAESGWLPEGALLAHANYPREGDVETLLERKAAVVYCPRSHAAFGHERHPVAEYVAAGVPVLLGTDSCASSPSLSLFDEMRFLRERRPDLPADLLWRMATEWAAPLVDGGVGRLVEGGEASLVVLDASPLTRLERKNVLDALTRGELRVIATLVHGEVCFAEPAWARRLLPLTRRSGGLSSLSSPGDGPEIGTVDAPRARVDR